MITLLIRMAICENTVTFSLTLLRDLLSFENWRGGGGANGIRGGGIAPLPPLWLLPCCRLYAYARYRKSNIRFVLSVCGNR